MKEQEKSILLCSSLAMWILRKPRQSLHLFPPNRDPLPKAHFWAHARRIDIHIEVPHVDFEKLSDDRRGEASEEIRARVEATKQHQRERFAGLNCNTSYALMITPKLGTKYTWLLSTAPI